MMRFLTLVLLLSAILVADVHAGNASKKCAGAKQVLFTDLLTSAGLHITNPEDVPVCFNKCAGTVAVSGVPGCSQCGGKASLSCACKSPDFDSAVGILVQWPSE
jgi:hypothetical protein